MSSNAMNRRQVLGVLGAATTGALVPLAAGPGTAHAVVAQLNWAPPVLDNPVTIQLGTGITSNNLDVNTDYIIKLPNTVKTGATFLQGGHHIVMIGGHIQLPSYVPGQTTDEQARAIYIKNNTGAVHIEGVLIDAVADGLGDGIAISSPDSVVQVENCRIVNLKGTDDDFHSDVVQPFGGVKELRIDKLTGSSPIHGLFLPHDLGVVGRVIVRRTNITALPPLPGSGEGDGQGVWLTPRFDPDGLGPTYIFADLYVQPREGHTIGFAVWPNASDPTNPVVVDASGFAHWPTAPNVTGGVQGGVPSSGDFVPAGVAGLGYVSPGYL